MKEDKLTFHLSVHSFSPRCTHYTWFLLKNEFLKILQEIYKRRFNPWNFTALKWKEMLNQKAIDVNIDTRSRSKSDSKLWLRGTLHDWWCFTFLSHRYQRFLQGRYYGKVAKKIRNKDQNVEGSLPVVLPSDASKSRKRSESVSSASPTRRNDTRALNGLPNPWISLSATKWFSMNRKVTFVN